MNKACICGQLAGDAGGASSQADSGLRSFGQVKAQGRAGTWAGARTGAAHDTIGPTAVENIDSVKAYNIGRSSFDLITEDVVQNLFYKADGFAGTPLDIKANYRPRMYRL
jgi:hypothetical protein